MASVPFVLQNKFILPMSNILFLLILQLLSHLFLRTHTQVNMTSCSSGILSINHKSKFSSSGNELHQLGVLTSKMLLSLTRILYWLMPSGATNPSVLMNINEHFGSSLYSVLGEGSVKMPGS